MSIEYNPGLLTFVDLRSADIHEFVVGDMLITPEFSAASEISFSCETDISPEAINTLCGLPKTITPINTSFDSVVRVMNRWHKRERIRKKWLKRYGTREEAVKYVAEIDEVSIDNGSVEFNVAKFTPHYTSRQMRRGYIVGG